MAHDDKVIYLKSQCDDSMKGPDPKNLFRSKEDRDLHDARFVIPIKLKDFLPVNEDGSTPSSFSLDDVSNVLKANPEALIEMLKPLVPKKTRVSKKALAAEAVAAKADAEAAASAAQAADADADEQTVVVAVDAEPLDAAGTEEVVAVDAEPSAPEAEVTAA